MPYWTHEQEVALTRMVEEGKPIEELCKHFRRSQEAVRLKIRRLGLALPQKTQVTLGSTTTLPQIRPATELISMEEMLKLLLGALKELQNPDVSSAEIKRCRTIVSTARSYLSMLKTYEKMSDLEQWLVNTNAKLLELTRDQLMQTEDPVERARLQTEISKMQQFLEEAASKHGYKPFEKKPSLMTPE